MSDQPNIGPGLAPIGDWQMGNIAPVHHEPDHESAFYEALAGAQAAFEPIHRSRTVKVALKTGGSYTFAYAPLETILAATVPALSAAGISLSQQIRIDTSFEEPIHYLRTSLRKGRFELHNEVMIFKTEATSQAYGASVTYARRMGVTLILCVAADDDNDGSDTQLVEQPMQRKDVAHRDELDQRPRPGYVPGSNAGSATRLGGAEPELTDKQRADLDAHIETVLEEIIEAANEGRPIGIESVWGETKGLEHSTYVQSRVWSVLQREYKDQFKTIRDVLRPAQKGARGPGRPDSEVPK